GFVMQCCLLMSVDKCVSISMFLKKKKAKRFRCVSGSSSVSRLCPAGCASCSALNGCLSCKPRLFFHLELDGIRQKGTCLSSCPQGHYGMRSPQINTCTRCKEDCAFCFSDNFCTRCHQGHFLLRGKCDNSCPNGLTANTLMQCIPQGERHSLSLTSTMHFCCLMFLSPPTNMCHINHLLSPLVHCEVGEWTEWGPCIRKRRMQAYRRGEETRTRQVLQSPSVFGDPCPHVSEFRRCVIKMRQSPSRL
uniref:R-spondin 3 n=1 Tax=Seriola dumerili TaxID=41447 RepID=A0A3B4UC11_SERDU